mgnify:CR=1 FL=1
MMDIEPDEFARKYRKGELDHALLLDVREVQEWEDYHLDEAALIPVNTLPDNVSRLDPKRWIYVFCAHGVRSLYACEFLQRVGFKYIVNVNGGLATVFHYLEQGDGDPIND